QFAGAFAAMARALGIPARVAVGFTPGSYDQRLGGYRVTTSEAHAWPEVRLEGFGWVAFEPTPGRNDVNPGDHTGTFVDPATAGSDGATEGSPAEASTPTAPAGGARDPRSRGEAENGDGASDEADSGASGTPLPITVGLVLLTAAVLVVVAVPMGKATRRIRRRAGSDPAVTLAAAWVEALERLRECGLRPLRTRTPLETALDVGSHRNAPVAEPLARLAFLVTAAAFSGRPVSRVEAGEAWRCLRRFTRAINASDKRGRRLLRRLHPATLLDPGIGRAG
ncbi:MAG: transglutaminase domain-containing protein, partial [Acidimicrobiia bacterium]